MSADTEPAPYVDDDLRDGLVAYLQRAIDSATPDSWVSGGAADDRPAFARRPRTYEQLKTYEKAYRSGGPLADLTDTRALMTYGTGFEFQTESPLTDEQGRTADEWLADALGGTLDYLQIQLGVQAYWAGNAWLEIVEARGGDFSHLKLIDPTTVDPDWDRHGDLTEIRQLIVEDGQAHSQPLDEDRVAMFAFTDTGGGPLEPGLYERNWEWIQRYVKNQKQRKNAIRLHGSPHYHIKVGSEGQSIPDKIIRRIRNRFSSDETDEKTNWVTGGDIEIGELDAPGFEGMDSITETDIAQLAQGMGLPLELTNFGSDGLGSGTPAEVRWQGFERQARAEQQLRIAQFIEQVARPLLDEYSPFPRDIDLEGVFGDVVSDQQAIAEWVSQVEWAFHRDEVREMMDHPPWDGDEDDEEAPPEIAPSATDPETPAGGGGLFSRDDPGEDAPDPLGEDGATKRAHADGGTTQTHRNLLHTGVERAELTREELVWEDVIERVLWSDDTERRLFQFDPEEVPDFAVDRLQDAIRAGALFADFDTIPDWAASRVGDTLLDSLETRHGWSVDSIAENLQSMSLGLDDREAEVIARTETQALVNKAREEGYREEFDDIEQERFDWVGPSDDRTTDACEWIKSQIPEEGVRLSTLKELIEEAPNHDDMISTDAREWTPHIQCRHSYTRQV